jgi:hypothetical protein
MNNNIPISYNDFKTKILEARDNNTLLTEKHDPNHFSDQYRTYRSVLTPEAVRYFDNLSDNGFPDVVYYECKDNPQKRIFAAEFYGEKPFDIAGSGICSMDSNPSSDLNTVFFVSGQKQGFHMYAGNLEDLSNSDYQRIGLLED